MSAPLRSRLVFLATPGRTLFEEIGRRLPVATAGAGIVRGKLGLAWSNVVAGPGYIHYAPHPSYALAGDIDFSVFVAVDVLGPADQTGGLIGHRDSSSTSGRWNLNQRTTLNTIRLGWSDAADANYDLDWDGAWSTGLHTYVLTRKKGGQVELWVDAVSQGTRQMPAAIGPGLHRLVVGSIGNTPISSPMDGEFYAAAIWRDRALSPAMIALLANDPFAMLRVPRNRRSIVKPSTILLSGVSATDLFTAATGSLAAGAAVLSGQPATDAFVASTGTLVPAAALDGQPALDEWVAAPGQVGLLDPGGATLSGQPASDPWTAPAGALVAGTNIGGSTAVDPWAAASGGLFTAPQFPPVGRYPQGANALSPQRDSRWWRDALFMHAGPYGFDLAQRVHAAEAALGAVPTVRLLGPAITTEAGGFVRWADRPTAWDLSTREEFTVAVCFDARDAGVGIRGILARRSNNSGGKWELYFTLGTAGNQVRFGWYDTPADTGRSVGWQGWYRRGLQTVVVTRRAGGFYELHYDGVSAGEVENTNPFSGGAGHDLYMGQRGTTTGEQLPGIYYSACVWGRRLSPAEIQQFARDPFAPFGTSRLIGEPIGRLSGKPAVDLWNATGGDLSGGSAILEGAPFVGEWIVQAGALNADEDFLQGAPASDAFNTSTGALSPGARVLAGVPASDTFNTSTGALTIGAGVLAGIPALDAWVASLGVTTPGAVVISGSAALDAWLVSTGLIAPGARVLAGSPSLDAWAVSEGFLDEAAAPVSLLGSPALDAFEAAGGILTPGAVVLAGLPALDAWITAIGGLAPGTVLLAGVPAMDAFSVSVGVLTPAGSISGETANFPWGAAVGILGPGAIGMAGQPAPDSWEAPGVGELVVGAVVLVGVPFSDPWEASGGQILPGSVSMQGIPAFDPWEASIGGLGPGAVVLSGQAAADLWEAVSGLIVPGGVSLLGQPAASPWEVADGLLLPGVRVLVGVPAFDEWVAEEVGSVGIGTAIMAGGPAISAWLTGTGLMAGQIVVGEFAVTYISVRPATGGIIQVGGAIGGIIQVGAN